MLAPMTKKARSVKKQPQPAAKRAGPAAKRSAPTRRSARSAAAAPLANPGRVNQQAGPSGGPFAGPSEVQSFIDALDHPLKPQMLELRKLILGLNNSIGEEIKWKSPSFHTTEHFATMNLRPIGGQPALCLILHTGAKVRKGLDLTGEIDDPAGLLKWLAKDRAMVAIVDADDLKAKRSPLKRVLQQWITHV